MAVKIRLRRMGAKKKPFYRVIVADSRSPRDGRFIEELGWFDPLKDPVEFKINVEAARKWLGDGAKPTDTARALLKKAGVYDAPTDETQADGEAVAQAAEAPAAAIEPEAAAPVAEAAAEGPKPVEEEKTEEAAVPGDDPVAESPAKDSADETAEENAPEESAAEAPVQDEGEGTLEAPTAEIPAPGEEADTAEEGASDAQGREEPEPAGEEGAVAEGADNDEKDER